MIKIKFLPLTIDREISLDSDSVSGSRDSLWHVSLPDDEPNATYLGLIPNVVRDLIADAAIRFSGNAVMMGLEVYPAGTILSDSTSLVAGWIENINNN